MCILKLAANVIADKTRLIMNTEQLIEKYLFGKKPEKWDDKFDRIQHLSVNDVRAMLDEHAKCVLSDVSGSLLKSLHQDLKGFQEMGFLTPDAKSGLGIAIEQVERYMRGDLEAHQQ